MWHRTLALLALAVSMTRPADAEVTAGITKDEFRCAAGVRKALAAQAAAHARCVQRCELAAAKVGGPYDDCVPFAYGGATALCLNDGGGAGGKGAENKSLATMRKACPEDGAKDTCPEEYEREFGSCAAMAAQRVANDHGTFSIFTQSIICEHQNFVTDPVDGKRKARCQAALAKAGVAHFATVTALFERCNAAILKGKLAPGACLPGATVDPKLSPGNTVPPRSAKTAAKIDKACFRAAALAPACYDGSALRPNTGAGWAALIDGITASTVNGRTFVASPSGAFVD